MYVRVHDRCCAEGAYRQPEGGAIYSHIATATFRPFRREFPYKEHRYLFRALFTVLNGVTPLTIFH